MDNRVLRNQPRVGTENVRSIVAFAGDSQHPFGSLATDRRTMRIARSTIGPELCVPALRLVCLFEDDDAAGPSSAKTTLPRARLSVT